VATIVLIHGATAGGWVWRPILPMLRSAGHVVYTPTLTGLGERIHLAHPGVDLETHIADIANVLAFEELEDVTLVGHSYGGMVITGVADREPQRVVQLIYLDALVPRNGEAAVDLVGSEVRQTFQSQVETQGDGWRIPIQRGKNDVGTHNTPHPFKTWTQPLALKTNVVSELPCAYVRCTADKQPGQFFTLALELSWQRAREANWPIRQVDTVHQMSKDPLPKGSVLLTLL
jgi:pimeloyl-ACP methyl ester carboxylesterase